MGAGQHRLDGVPQVAHEEFRVVKIPTQNTCIVHQGALHRIDRHRQVGDHAESVRNDRCAVPVVRSFEPGREDDACFRAVGGFQSVEEAVGGDCLCREKFVLQVGKFLSEDFLKIEISLLVQVAFVPDENQFFHLRNHLLQQSDVFAQEHSGMENGHVVFVR